VGLVGRIAARGAWAAERSAMDELGNELDDDGGMKSGLSMGMHI
jgi:hypothetical protein